MTIRAKLTMNVAVVVLIVASVAATGVGGASFVRRRLVDLTERSAPFQKRALELDRSAQAAIADLIRAGAATNAEELKSSRAEAETALNAVGVSEAALAEFAGGESGGTHRELREVAAELFKATEGKLAAEAEVGRVSTDIDGKLQETERSLRDLDTKIRRLQQTRSAAFAKSMDTGDSILGNLRNVEALSTSLKDLQLGVAELQRAEDKKTAILARSKINTALAKAMKNPSVESSTNLGGDLRSLGATIEEMVKFKMASGASDDPGAKSRFDALKAAAAERLSATQLAVEQDLLIEGDKQKGEAKQQREIFSGASRATGVLAGASELVAEGITVRAGSARALQLTAAPEIDALEATLRKNFERIGALTAKVNADLKALGARGEAGSLNTAATALSQVREMIFSPSGVLATVRSRLEMKARAADATGKVRQIVVRAAERSKASVATARTAEEASLVSLHRGTRLMTLLIGLIGAAAAVAAVAFGTWVYRSISRPLLRLGNVASTIADGDLHADVEGGTNDEVGAVQSSMAKMVGNLRTIVTQLRAATQSLASSSEELSVTAASLEQGSSEQTSQVAQSAVAIEEMATTNAEVAQNISATAEAARTMRQIALTEKEAMVATNAEMADYGRMALATSERISALAAKSAQINEVVSLIKDIADQTNLLALNAAIEASRAGEHGRGFAVVADNVRTLAERTAQAAAEIAGSLKAMQSDIQTSAGVMAEQKLAIERVGGRVTRAADAMGTLVTRVAEVADMVDRVAVAAEEQSATSGTIAGSMERIDQVTRSLNASTSEIKNASEDLLRLASGLESQVGWFKV